MKCLLYLCILTLASCTTSSAAPQSQQSQQAFDEAKKDKFFECMVELGPNQSKGIDECQKLL